MSIHVRFAEPDDRSQWEALWRGYQQFYETDLSAGTDALWRRLMHASGDGPYALVAVGDDHVLLGLAHYLYHATTWSEAPRCYLNDLFTAPQARGRGVGRALIEAVYDRADRHGAGQVYWLTQQFNATARRLYDEVATVTPFIKYVR
ncbi:MAG: GCN5 family N-acetyltransferase [Alphaproteobacteria bacterium]|nr:MAG: GCN5 family N-acetyltransferase [Alphaproteobacteria bacterium]